MPDPASFAEDDNWAGGFYELSMDLGEADHERLDRALTSVWEFAGISGCYGNHRAEPTDQPLVAVSLETLEQFGHLRGVVTPPNHRPTVCGCVATRLGDGTDWLTFYLPLGALVNADPRIGGYPFGEEGGPSSLRWRLPLDGWLAWVGTAVFERVPFRRGAVGFETDGVDIGDETPDQRYVGYLLPIDGRLTYTPANR